MDGGFDVGGGGRGGGGKGGGKELTGKRQKLAGVTVCINTLIWDHN